jgi:2-methylisocitrate lyase-like PEP mutase family enzyme
MSESALTQSAKADVLRRLHHGPPILVLPNAWDVASARKLAALPGCRALATTSAAAAACLGFEDGEQTPVDEMVRACSRIAAAVEIPVTADLERG